MILKDFFTYSIDFDSVAAGLSETDNIQIQADADFEIQKLTFFADIAGAAQTVTTSVIPLMSVLLVDAGSGRQLMDRALAVPALFGDGKIPFILPTTRILAARSNLTVTVVNFSAATTYRLRLNFIGTKLFQT